MFEWEEVIEDERELEVVLVIVMVFVICSVNRKGWEISFKLCIGVVFEKENRYWVIEERMVLGWLLFFSKKK